MSEPPAAVPKQEKTPSTAVNVLSNWAWYALTIISGFLLPRLIEKNDGRALLGVWDLCWTLVTFVNLLMMGIVSAVARYTARYRTMQDWESINRSFNSSTFLLTISFLLAVTLVVSINFVRLMLPDTTPEDLIRYGYLVSIVLVTAAALDLPAGPLQGIITGYERFDRLNIIRWSRDFLMLISMIAALLLGYSLLTLAVIMLLAAMYAAIAKFIVARQLCPTLRIAPHFCSFKVMKKMLHFGGKSALQEVSRNGLYTAASIFVSRNLGEASMAIYSRQRNLVMHAHRFTKQFSQVFVPKSAALQAGADTKAIRELLVTSARWGFYIAIPIIAFLVIAGTDFVEVWMSSTDYRRPLVMLALALGHLPALGQMSAYSVLMGLGKHGVATAIEFGSAIVAIAAMFLIIPHTNDLMTTVAFILGGSVALSGGVLIPAYACRLLKLPQLQYWRMTLTRPIVVCLPFIAVLLAIQWFVADNAKQRVLLSITAGGIINAFIYWQFVLPPHFRNKILTKLRLVRTNAGTA